MRVYNELLNHMGSHFRREELILAEIKYTTDWMSIELLTRRCWKKAVANREKLMENKIDTQSLFAFIMKEVIISHLVKEDIMFFNLF